MNWHWVSGGRHWSSSSTPGQSVGLNRSFPAPPPPPPALLPPSRMWLILMLKGNSWPERERERGQRSRVCLCTVYGRGVQPKAKTWLHNEVGIMLRGKEPAGMSWDGTRRGTKDRHKRIPWKHPWRLTVQKCPLIVGLFYRLYINSGFIPTGFPNFDSWKRKLQPYMQIFTTPRYHVAPPTQDSLSFLQPRYI